MRYLFGMYLHFKRHKAIAVEKIIREVEFQA
jgi:hypothetical protein